MLSRPAIKKDSGLSDNREPNRSSRQSGKWPTLIVGLIYEVISNFQNAKSDDKYRASQDRSSRLTAYATVAMAAFTFVILIVGIFQYRAMNGQLSVMQGQLDAMERDQAPYMSIDDRTRAPQFRIFDGIIGWEWHVMNFGKGGAVDLSTDSFIRIGGDGRFKRSPGAKGPAFLSEMPPGKDNFGVTVAESVSQDDFNKLIAETYGISLLLEFKYFDITGTKPFQNAVCIGHIKGGGLAALKPAECQKSKSE
jgi:hypothetical protein